MAPRTYDMTDSELADAYSAARLRIDELEAALEEAIEGWQDGANYKSDRLREKHQDAEGIAKVRAVLQKK